MIRVTIDLHIVSKGQEGGYWASTLTKYAWEDYKKTYTWCKDDGELRAELKERHGYSFMLLREHIPMHEAIEDRIGFSAKVETVRSWPKKLDPEEEFSA